MTKNLEGAKPRIRVAPEICSYVDDGHEFLTLEISIPGVPRSDIVLKMHADSFSLSAPREDIEYVTAMSFCCPVKPESANASYQNGLLKVVVPFKDRMKDSIRIEVQ
jgi:HSP20 family protein